MISYATNSIRDWHAMTRRWKTAFLLIATVLALLALCPDTGCSGSGLYQYGVWQPDDRILSLPFVDGAVAYLGWNALEPEEGFVDLRPIQEIRSRAREIQKKLIIRIVSAELTPGWVYRKGVPKVLDVTDHDPKWVPLYWHPKYLEALEAFIGRVGPALDGDPVIEAVQIGIARYGEMCIEGEDWLRREVTPSLWTDTCIAVLDIYKRHFRHTPLLVMIMSADLPGGRWTQPMQEVAAYAAAHGIGLQFNGLSPDNSYLWGLKDEPDKDSAIGIFRQYAGKVPLSFELTNDKVDPRLSCMNALSEHASFLSVHTTLLANPTLAHLFLFAHYFLGRDVRTSGAVWSLLRQTNPDAAVETGKKNYEFGLKQVEFASAPLIVLGKQAISMTGKTIALNDFMGLPCRRTVGSDGSGMMAFRIAPEFDFGAKSTVSVVYADVGSDMWSLWYMTDAGFRRAGSVQKQNTGQWLLAEFEAPCLSRGKDADILIDSVDYGDEYIHYVQLTRAGATVPFPLSLPRAPTPASANDCE